MDPLKNRQAGTTKTAWSLINDTLCNGGVIPKNDPLDNEASIKLNVSKMKNQVSISPSTHPPHNWCWTCHHNLENQFLSGLTSTDIKIPASEWYRLIPQADLTLNILQN